MLYTDDIQNNISYYKIAHLIQCDPLISLNMILVKVFSRHSSF